MTNNFFQAIRPTKIAFYLRYIKRQGLDENELFKGTNLREQSLKGKYGAIEIPEYIRVISNLMQLIPKPNLAFDLGDELKLGDLGLLGYAVCTSENIFEGAAIWKKYSHLFFGSLFSINVTFDGETHKFEFIPEIELVPKLLRFLVEEKFAFEVRLFRDFCQCRPLMHTYSFTYAKPTHAQSYDRLFDTDLKFNQEKCIYAVDANDEVFLLPFHGANRETNAVCIKNLDTISNAIYARKTFSAKLRDEIRAQLPHLPTAEEMAKIFNCSPRTFRRYLEAENTHYGAEVASVRESLAKGYLATTSQSTGEIAHKLGFMDVNSLRRAFKTWTNMTLQDYSRIQEATSLED